MSRPSPGCSDLLGAAPGDTASIASRCIRFPGAAIPPVNRAICPPKRGSAAQCLIDTASLGVALCIAPHPSEGSREDVPQDAERVDQREQTPWWYSAQRALCPPERHYLKCRTRRKLLRGTQCAESIAQPKHASAGQSSGSVACYVGLNFAGTMRTRMFLLA
jgi:hypothetical protein